MKRRTRPGGKGLSVALLLCLAVMVFLIIRYPVGMGVCSGVIALLVLSTARVAPAAPRDEETH